eukprot:354567-Alexandrium_andersonii.AAC.1
MGLGGWGSQGGALAHAHRNDPTEALFALAQDRAVWSRLAAKIKRAGADSAPEFAVFEPGYRNSMLE